MASLIYNNDTPVVQPIEQPKTVVTKDSIFTIKMLEIFLKNSSARGEVAQFSNCSLVVGKRVCKLDEAGQLIA